MRAADYQDRIGPDRRGHSAERCDQCIPPALCTSGKCAACRTDAPAGPDTTPGSAPNAGHTRAPPHSSARRTAATDVPRSIFPGKGSDSRERHTGAVPLSPPFFRLTVMGYSMTAADKAAVIRTGGTPSAPFPSTQKGAPAGHSLVVFLNTAIITQVYVSFYNTLKIFSQAWKSFWLKASCKT